MVNLRSGLRRLGMSLWLLWFSYWTCAYMIQAQPSENHPLPLPLLTYLALTPFLLAAAALGIRWIIAGFRATRVRLLPQPGFDLDGEPQPDPHPATGLAGAAAVHGLQRSEGG